MEAPSAYREWLTQETVMLQCCWRYNAARVIYHIAMRMIALRMQFSRLAAILPLTVLFRAISIKYLRGEIIFAADK